MTDQPSVVPAKVESVPETERDPIRIMVEIAENKNLSDKDKSQLIGQTCEGILASIKSNQNLIAWIEGFLTAIVAAYYGVSAWRPAS